ncbi:hypothetical protein KAI78_04270 [bacterium]|nr:hypothetical protein [bacterium]MCK5598817.1 hypothetical protein [bacterium]
MDIQKKEIYLGKGAIEIKINSGRFEIIGGEYTEGTFKIPQGKQLPFICLEPGSLDITGGEWEKLEKSTIPAIWYEIPEMVKKNNVKKILVYGEVDTGKSFFSTFIANRLMDMGLKTGVIDTDTGQSDIGAPGTIGYGLFDKKYSSLSSVPVEKEYFIGNLSPGGSFAVFLAGISKVAQYASKTSDVFIMDTTGWVHGDGGRSIKRAKTDIVDPDMAILLQRGTELEHLVQHLPESKIVRIKVSKSASFTSQEVRRQLRETISKRYFKNAKEVEFSLDQVNFERTYLGSGVIEHGDFLDVLRFEKLPAWEGNLMVFAENIEQKQKAELLAKYPNTRWFRPSYLKDIYVGIADSNGFALSVGTIQKVDFLNKKITVLTPLADSTKNKAAFIQMGLTRYEKDGTEAGFVVPGSI